MALVDRVQVTLFPVITGQTGVRPIFEGASDFDMDLIESRTLDGHTDPNPELDELDALVDVVADDQLRLMFLCCHPALSADAQVALTLRLLGGLDTAEIAHAFVVPEATIAQRIVRAKRKLRDNHAPYRIPRHAELPTRLGAVLAAIYLVFTEGHTATIGPDLTRNDLGTEAIRLGRVLVELMPDEPEAVGLLALMLLTDARRPARTDTGAMVRLADQDRSMWNGDLINEGHRLVRPCLRRNQPGPYQINAAIAAAHADATTAASTDWAQIVALYDQLADLRPNPIVHLNRAVAIAARHGSEAGLDALEQIDRTRLAEYQPYHATRADLLARSGRHAEALTAYDTTIELTTNPIEADFLTNQRDHAASHAPPEGMSAAFAEIVNADTLDEDPPIHHRSEHSDAETTS